MFSTIHGTRPEVSLAEWQLLTTGTNMVELSSIMLLQVMFAFLGCGGVVQSGLVVLACSKTQ